MKKIFATFMMMAMLAIILPLAANAQTYTTRRVYRNGRWQTVRVYRTTERRNSRYRQSRVTPQERRRLARERSRYVRLRNRTTRDGVVTRRESRKLDRRARKYNRDIRRARNN